MSVYLRNAWYVAAWGEEITDGVYARRLLNEPVVLFRDRGGKVRALEDRCCHRGAPLSVGELVPEGIRCGYHSLTFNGDGVCVNVPGQTHVPDNARVKSYPVVEKDEFVWVWMGDPAKPSTDKLVDYPYANDKKNWPNLHAVLPVKSNYRLLLDNLLDLSHLGTVHKSTIGGNPQQHASARTRIYKTPTGVKYIRWMLDSVAPPSFAAMGGFEGRIDRWQEFEFVAPATIKQYSGAVDVGTGIYERADKDGRLDIDARDGGVHIRLIHSITPVTDNTCTYYWTSANGHKTDDPKMCELLFNSAATAFDEDKRMVEHQQTRLENFDESRLIDINSDAPRLQMFRHLTQLIEAENGRPAAAAAE